MAPPYKENGNGLPRSLYCSKYRFYFSKLLMIYFWEDNDYIAISYTGKERRGDRRFL